MRNGTGMSLRNKLIKRLITWLRDYIPIGKLSYSQEGEDIILSRIFGSMQVRSGFFVDIGAHHPTRFSNTYYFYRRGWCGINVDSLPGTRKLFHRMRPRDITIECGVGLKEANTRYFVFNEPALNTFSIQEASKKAVPPYRIVNTLQVPVVTLKKILDEHLPAGMQIDFMTVDVEGFDHAVISSNDWSKYRPRIVLVELLDVAIQNVSTHPTAQVLIGQGYRMIAKTHNTYFFATNEKDFEIKKR